tara:strand:- start:3084 stop:4937 length:1854 start_codon:yes stop_codon:yes gene_type:complete
MPISYDGKYIVPAPFLGISKTYIRTSDGQKVGATYNITLEGTLIPQKGSPNSKGVFADDANYTPPDDETDIDIDKLQHSFMKKTEALRDLFSTDGKLLEISSWLENSEGGAVYPAISGYPRITSIDFPSNQYVQTLPFSITLELDEVIGVADETSRGETVYGSEDFKNSDDVKVHESGQFFNEPGTAVSDGKPIYLSAADENWQIDFAGNRKGEMIPQSNPSTCDAASHNIDHRQTQVYNITHTITATGKNAYDGNGLIRKPWENAKLWVDGKVGLPTENDNYTKNFEDIFGFGTGPSGDYDNYKLYNHVRSKNADYSNGTYNVTENWVMAKTDSETNHNVFDDCNVDLSYDRNTGLATVNVAGTITGLETRKSCTIGERDDADYDNVTESAFAAAKAYFEDVYEDSTGGPGESTFSIYEYAKKCFSEQYISSAYEDSLGTSLKKEHISKTVSQNVSNGSISYSFVFNNRPQFISGSKTETYSAQDKKAVSKYATLEVPGRVSGPILQNMNTKELASVTVTVDILMPNQRAVPKPTSWNGDDVTNGIILQRPLATESIAKGARRITLPTDHPCHPDNQNNTLIIVSDQQETFDSTSGKYNLSTTYTYQTGCTTVQFG